MVARPARSSLFPHESFICTAQLLSSLVAIATLCHAFSPEATFSHTPWRRLSKLALFANDNHNKRAAAADRNTWQIAPEPNYVTNTYLKFQCNGTSLNRSTINSPILDFWGEGRNGGRKDSGLQTGFRKAYNLNYRYQLVNPASDDGGRKIPNLIPSHSYQNPNAQLYIDSDTFPFVTLMGAPIIKRAAEEMTRVVCNDGMLVLYGEADPESVSTFEVEAVGIGFARDRLTELLIDRVRYLKDDEIVIAGHPQQTRAYINNRDAGRETSRTGATKSKWISGGAETSSEYCTGEGRALIGRRHHGGEMGQTFYRRAKIRLCNRFVRGACDIAYDTSGWVHGECESRSSYICPTGAVLMGRKHDGDENGKTWYRYGWVSLRGKRCKTYGFRWTKISTEADSVFECKDGEVIVGRKHYGDESGPTWYMTAKVKLADSDWQSRTS